MHKLVVLYPEPADREAFAAYYENTHLPLAKRMPGLLASRYTLNASAQGASYFAVFEAEFADRDAFIAAVQSPEGQAVAADVPNYASGGAVLVDYPVTEL